MEHFTPVSAAIGGALIGISAVLLWIANGRIAGISGIIGGLLTARSDDIAWRVAFLIGLIAAPLVYGWSTGSLPRISVSVPPLIVIAGGLLVGFGTRLGGGCTSGHGVCGLARLSPRSIVATALFMTTAVVTSLFSASRGRIVNDACRTRRLLLACFLASGSPSLK
jgi:uncharacterized membrane protein YedE/YeeE